MAQRRSPNTGGGICSLMSLPLSLKKKEAISDATKAQNTTAIGGVEGKHMGWGGIQIWPKTEVCMG